MTIAGPGEGNLTGCYAGLRVLDFSTTIAGPHCTRMLADNGAEVIKIEPAEGETMRTRPPVRNHCSTAFGQLNIGKNSVVLDLKSPAGIEAVRRLIASADVLVENFRPGTLDGWGLPKERLFELNPKLTILRVSGFGQTGPYARKPAFARIGEALSGLTYICGDPDRAPMHVNRWGYIAETTCGDETALVGVMTDANEAGTAGAANGAAPTVPASTYQLLRDRLHADGFTTNFSYDRNNRLLAKGNRLSVMPLTEHEFEAIVAHATARKS